MIKSVTISFEDLREMAEMDGACCTGPCSPDQDRDVKTAGLFDRRPLRTFVVNRIKERFRGQGYTEAQIDQAIELLEGERPILDWLMNGGFEAILKFIAAILAMFG